MTGPREWRHTEDCPWLWSGTCTCGLSAVRDAIAAGHRVVVGPEGVEGRLAKPLRPVGGVPMTDPLSPTPLSERDPVLKHIRTLSSGSLSKAEVNWLCDEIDRLAALNEAAADFIDGETTESETLAIIDRLSSGVAEPPAEDREQTT